MPDVSAEGRRVLSGNRQVIVGLGVLLLALPLWWGTDHFVPSLTAKRVVATAICYTLHDASEAQLRGALIAAPSGNYRPSLIIATRPSRIVSRLRPKGR